MSGKKNNRELYQAVFSKLHSQADITACIQTDQTAKKRRCSRPLAVCASLALLLCATSGVTYAATGGETCNPVTAIRVCINGEDYSASLEQNEDGSYIVHMKPGDRAEIDTGNGTSSSIQVAGYEEGISTDVRIDPNTGSSSVILNTGTENTQEDGVSAP